MKAVPTGLPLLWLLLASAPGLAAERAVVLLPLDHAGVDAAVAEGVAAMLEEAVAGLEGHRPLALTARLAKLARRCKAEQLDCLAEVADRRGADLALFGALRGRSDELELHLRLLEVAGRRELREAVEPLAGSDTAVRAGVRRAAIQLLLPERFVGTLTVDCNVPKARIRVDGTTRGSTPLQMPIEGIAEGSHVVQVEKHGYTTHEQTVQVVFERNVHVDAALLRRTDVTVEEVAAAEAEVAAEEQAAGPWRPGLETTAWVIAGAGGALLLGGIATGIATLVQVGELERRAHGQVLVSSHDAETIERGRLLALLTNVLHAVGGLLAAGGVGAGVWDLVVPAPAAAVVATPPPRAGEDWDDDVVREEDGEDPVGAAPVPAAGSAPPVGDDAPGGAELPDGDLLPEGDL